VTALDLAAVCARHGLIHGQSTDGLWWCETPDQNPGVAGYDSAADAVCALLKARWGIRTNHEPTSDFPWMAELGEDLCDWDFGDSELACVVALADRLARLARVTT
jgi:hypothetical protein